MLENKYYDNKMMLLILIMPLTLFSKWFQFNVLPPKYFYDSSRMLSMLTGSNTMQAWGGGYEVVIDVFKVCDVFGFTTLEEWAMLICWIFSIILIVCFARIKNPDFMQTVFLLLSIGLLNIYVFNISKEIIQFFIFFLMYLIVIQKNMKPFAKLVICFCIFFWESTFFRSYYIMMGALFVLVYFILMYIQKKSNRITYANLLGIFILIFIAVFALIYLSQYISYEDYEAVLHVRDSHRNEGAATAIIDVFETNGNLTMYMINYVINAIRMMFPVELLTKGVFYIPFVLYQCFILFYIALIIKRLNRQIDSVTILSIAILFGYLLGSFMFEPDFGSFVRHEAATFPILHLIASNKYTYLKRS